MRIASRLARMLVSWPFIASVATLWLNDRVWKAAFANAVTGKLSDVAGLALVGMLAAAAFPRGRRIAMVAIGLAFAYWKSPCSEPLVQALAAVSPWPVRRVVDASDLVALCVLPFGARVAANPQAWRLPLPGLRRWLVVPVGVASLLAVMGTTVPPPPPWDFVLWRGAGSPPSPEAVAATVERAARAWGMDCETCEGRPMFMRFEGAGLTLVLRQQQAGEAWLLIRRRAPGVFVSSKADERERLRTALRSAFDRELAGFDYQVGVTPWSVARPASASVAP